MSIVTIIGAGMMGSAMSVPALDNGHTVRLCGTPLDTEIIDGLKSGGFHKTLKRTLSGNISFFYHEEIKDALRGADIVVCGVSSFGVEWFADEILPLLSPDIPVLSITKGLKTLEDGTLIPFPVYLKSRRPDVSFNAVGGPCISFELCDRIHTEVAFCGFEMQTLRSLRSAFETGYYHLTLTTDIAGIETAVALKNAYAMAVSLAIGLYSGQDNAEPEKYNAQAGLFYEAVKEMGGIVKLIKGNEQSLFFGAGDLYVTVFGGRTRRLGTLLGAGLDMEQSLKILKGVTLESVAIIKVVYEYLARKGAEKDYPLMCHIYERITSDKISEIPWEKFATEY